MESVPKPTTKQQAARKGASYRQALQQGLLRGWFHKDGDSISFDREEDLYWQERGITKAELRCALESWEGPGRIEFDFTPYGVKAVWREQ